MTTKLLSRVFSTTLRPPVPPFTKQTALLKVRLAEDAWNSKDAGKVSLAYTVDSRWRNRSEFLKGREEIVKFLENKWKKEKEYKLIKQLWAFSDDQIGVRFCYEWYDEANAQWKRSYGNEMWKFDENGLMKRREASINDVDISEEDRKFLWTGDKRPEDHPGLDELDM
jgi:nuclear transport factor 2 (NTF2) superfamily protein